MTEVLRQIFFGRNWYGLAINRVLVIEKVDQKLTWDSRRQYKTTPLFSIKTTITKQEFDKLDFFGKKDCRHLISLRARTDLFRSREYLSNRVSQIEAAVRSKLVKRGLLLEELIATRRICLLIGGALMAIGLLFIDLPAI